jgi:hypothetical protein
MISIIKRFIIKTVAQDIQGKGIVAGAITDYRNEVSKRTHEEWNGPGTYDDLMKTVRSSREQSISEARRKAELSTEQSL